jgi:hypothetical protein
LIIDVYIWFSLTSIGLFVVLFNTLIIYINYQCVKQDYKEAN